ncbi:hypothetical protein BV22DRAFT_1116802 [Leucogyrophana mollusca]|uniref:Uncharacterized protein n=1 Tax=Leucogyrophana mollusca TaxID=85980 RepID=A0ACB8BVR3_9AGAM|nr:hypothetical protein BV22DRAFT_1116802 [Leucogyrophana mollusca]
MSTHSSFLVILALLSFILASLQGIEAFPEPQLPPNSASQPQSNPTHSFVPGASPSNPASSTVTTFNTAGTGSPNAGGGTTSMASGSAAPQSSGPGGSLSATSTTTANFPSLSGYPICVSQCLAIAASSANCTSVIAVDCFCVNATFADTIVSCTARECYANIQEAENLAKQFCNLATMPNSLSFPPPPPTTSLPGASVTPVSIVTGPESTTANAGTGFVPLLDATSLNALLMSMGVVIVGALAGATVI